MFKFALAERLGMSVKRLLSEMDSRELSQWYAYFEFQHRLRVETMQRAELEDQVMTEHTRKLKE